MLRGMLFENPGGICNRIVIVVAVVSREVGETVAVCHRAVPRNIMHVEGLAAACRKPGDIHRNAQCSECLVDANCSLGSALGI